ncbi:MAG: hypothetical protein J1F35_05215 [Erysipelotrichales bacterium]|nr:hypothetical protein [Erysipelotrichales bacterium]
MKKRDVYVAPIYMDKKINDETKNISTDRITVCDQAVLVKNHGGAYVWLNEINTLEDMFLFYMCLSNIIETEPQNNEEFYTDESKAVPYFDINEHEQKIGVKKLKREILLDPRLPGGVEY